MLTLWTGFHDYHRRRALVEPVFLSKDLGQVIDELYEIDPRRVREGGVRCASHARPARYPIAAAASQTS